MLSKKLLVLGAIALFGYGCGGSLIPGGSVSTDKKAYKPNDTINVDWTIVGAEVGDCVVIAEKDSAPDIKLLQKAADGNSSGKVSFQPGYRSASKPLVARYFKGCEMTADAMSAESDAFTYSN